MSPLLPGPKPVWLRRTVCLDGPALLTENYLAKNGLNSVCEAAGCPNRATCFAKKRATFLLMGNICTRACRYCGVAKGKPLPLDAQEPEQIRRAALSLSLSHVVLTSVTRDDLADGGAAHFVATIMALRRLDPAPTIETLIPDFGPGLQALLDAKPEVINHNIETVPRLFKSLRPRASLKNSLAILHQAAQQGHLTKSGFMVGMGETEAEIVELLKTLADIGVNIVTIGQYLPPSPRHHPVARYVNPIEYDSFAEVGRKLGINYVFAGPLVRSSYLADELFSAIRQKKSDHGNT